MSARSNRLNFPRLHGMQLRSFSLYSLEPTVNADFSDGVFCLAGANGLGKSTFLSALNYALSGIVANPERRFESVEEYYKHSLSFSAEYFNGRISEKDREAAEVRLEFTVGEHRYTITRGIFEPEELRSLSVIQAKKKVIDGADMSPGERHEAYKQQLAQDVGLASFEQFVFLLHFVLTFDERRHLLFWDQRVLEQALYLAFGVSRADAKRADTLRRESEKADSLARNFNWQATEVRKKINDIRVTAMKKPEGDVDLAAEHQQLIAAGESCQRRVSVLEGQQHDANLRLATLTSREVSLRASYADEFSQRIQTQTHITHHPLVVASINDSNCGLCGTHGEHIANSIRNHTSKDHCPLCGSTVSKQRDRPRDISKLRTLDEDIAKTKADLEETVKSLQRIDAELKAAREERDRTLERLREFESANSAVLSKIEAGNQTDSLDAVVRSYQRQMEELLERKRIQYERRDERRRDLRKLQQALEQQYMAAETEFVPLFKELAYQFLGIDLDIRLESQTGPGVNLVLEVRNAPRRQHHQLSESQRFFIDIALRMALAQFMSTNQDKATLLIDTPEGSLDIAYEKRAGDMLASFISKGYHIVMTANINSSRLLQALASKVGHSKMRLCRMTSWTELSEVQVTEEKLFEEAYTVIENSLQKRTGARR